MKIGISLDNTLNERWTKEIAIIKKIINEAGGEVVIAESFARIFFRKCVNGGYLVPYEAVEKINDKVETGDDLEIDLTTNTVRNLTKNEEYSLNPLGDIKEILEAGDVFEYAKKVGISK